MYVHSSHTQHSSCRHVHAHHIHVSTHADAQAHIYTQSHTHIHTQTTQNIHMHWTDCYIRVFIKVQVTYVIFDCREKAQGLQYVSSSIQTYY